MRSVVQIGLGPIGKAIALRASRCPRWELVGAVDPDPALAGRDLGELLGYGPPGVVVSPSLEAVLEHTKPSLALHATGSFLDQVADQLRQLIRAKLNIVSTCEELSFPYYRHPELSRELDALAREAGVVLLGTGVNPGFVMDKLVITLMGACDSVRSLRVYRVVNAATRRAPFQRKIGAGLTPGEFEQRRAAGGFGHIGLVESAHMLAEAMGVGPERTVSDELRPKIADRPVKTDVVSVVPGQAAGIDQTVILEAGGVERVRMELQMYVGAEHPRDGVAIDGEPSMEMEIGAGLPGDEGTAAVTISSAHLVSEIGPGLRTMLDVPFRPGS